MTEKCHIREVKCVKESFNLQTCAKLFIGERENISSLWRNLTEEQAIMRDQNHKKFHITYEQNNVEFRFESCKLAMQSAKGDNRILNTIDHKITEIQNRFTGTEISSNRVLQRNISLTCLEKRRSFADCMILLGLSMVHDSEGSLRI